MCGVRLLTHEHGVTMTERSSPNILTTQSNIEPYNHMTSHMTTHSVTLALIYELNKEGKSLCTSAQPWCILMESGTNGVHETCHMTHPDRGGCVTALSHDPP